MEGRQGHFSVPLQKAYSFSSTDLDIFVCTSLMFNFVEDSDLCSTEKERLVAKKKHFSLGRYRKIPHITLKIGCVNWLRACTDNYSATFERLSVDIIFKYHNF